MGADREWKLDRKQIIEQLQAEVTAARERMTSGFHPDSKAKARAESAFDDALMRLSLFRSTGKVFSQRRLAQISREAAARRMTTR